MSEQYSYTPLRPRLLTYIIVDDNNEIQAEYFAFTGHDACAFRDAEYPGCKVFVQVNEIPLERLDNDESDSDDCAGD